ncbi:transposase [Synechococcus sp. CS-1329]|uniref:transposase n=1 Tax=Synechococcus sp. CS-1329 TaxID=2847975 RepID=UPI00223AEBCB|nr:transposase [Synechococcus sp. CS-1329]MCT0217486.1 transposase [Synechococcus sp. CS-1329]
MLAFRHFQQQHGKKVWSTNLLVQVNEEIKRRTRVVGIFPNDASITRLVGAVLLEQDEHWQLEGRRMFSAESMAAIPSLEELPAQPSLQEAAALAEFPADITAKIAGVGHNRSAIQAKDLTSQSYGFTLNQ